MFRTPARLFRASAIAEAITWTILIAAMIARAFGAPGIVVTIGGGIHGLIFLAYLVTAVLVALNQRWSIGVAIIAGASAVIPYATIPVDIWVHRSGRLEGEWRLEGTDHPYDRVWVDRLLRWFLRRPWVLAGLLIVGVVGVYVVLLLVGPPGGR